MDKSAIKKLLDKINNLDRKYIVNIAWSAEEEESIHTSYVNKEIDLVIVRLYA